MKRAVDWIVIHCTDHDRVDQTVEMVRSWQVDPRFNGGSPLSDIAYHFLILHDGTIAPGRPLDKPGAGEPGYNGNGVHVALCGKLRFNGNQTISLDNLLRFLKSKYPKAKLVAHRDISKKGKTCPNLDITWLKERWEKSY